MDLTTLQERMNDMRDDENTVEDDPIRLVTAKVGQISEGELMMESDGLSDDEKAAHRRDMFAGAVMSLLSYATEHDIDVERALTELIEEIEDAHERRAEMAAAFEDMDAEELADAAAGRVDDSDDDSDPRYIG